LFGATESKNTFVRQSVFVKCITAGRCNSIVSPFAPDTLSIVIVLLTDNDKRVIRVRTFRTVSKMFTKTHVRAKRSNGQNPIGSGEERSKLFRAANPKRVFRPHVPLRIRVYGFIAMAGSVALAARTRKRTRK